MTIEKIEIKPHEQREGFYSCVLVSTANGIGRITIEIICAASTLRILRNDCNRILGETVVEKPSGKPNILEGKLKDFGK